MGKGLPLVNNGMIRKGGWFYDVLMANNGTRTMQHLNINATDGDSGNMRMG